MISPDLQEHFWRYLGGIARENEMKALAVGGMEDHVHMLVSLPSTLAVAKGIQLIKGGSSKWIHDSFPKHDDFAWQEGYGAFSIGVCGFDDTTAHINKQAEHHRVKTFEEEFMGFLERHGIAYDRKYVFG